MRILKRPSPSSNLPSNINTTIGESLQDREARYVAARERIFRTSTSEVEPAEGTRPQYNFGEKPSPSSSTISSQPIRELRGPTFGDGTNNSSIKGFVHRRADRSKNTVSLPLKTPSEDTSLWSEFVPPFLSLNSHWSLNGIWLYVLNCIVIIGNRQVKWSMNVSTTQFGPTTCSTMEEVNYMIFLL